MRAKMSLQGLRQRPAPLNLDDEYKISESDAALRSKHEAAVKLANRFAKTRLMSDVGARLAAGMGIVICIALVIVGFSRSAAPSDDFVHLPHGEVAKYSGLAPGYPKTRAQRALSRADENDALYINAQLGRLYDDPLPPAEIERLVELVDAGAFDFPVNPKALVLVETEAFGSPRSKVAREFDSIKGDVEPAAEPKPSFSLWPIARGLFLFVLPLGLFAYFMRWRHERVLTILARAAQLERRRRELQNADQAG